MDGDSPSLDAYFCQLEANSESATEIRSRCNNRKATPWRGDLSEVAFGPRSSAGSMYDVLLYQIFESSGRSATLGFAASKTRSLRGDPFSWYCGCALGSDLWYSALEPRDTAGTAYLRRNDKVIGTLLTTDLPVPDSGLPERPTILGKLGRMIQEWTMPHKRLTIHCDGELFGQIDVSHGVGASDLEFELLRPSGKTLPVLAGGSGNDGTSRFEPTRTGDMVIPVRAAELTEEEREVYFLVNVLFRLQYFQYDFC